MQGWTPPICVWQRGSQIKINMIIWPDAHWFTIVMTSCWGHVSLNFKDLDQLVSWIFIWLNMTIFQKNRTCYVPSQLQCINPEGQQNNNPPCWPSACLAWMQLCLCRILQIDEVTLHAMLQRVLVYICMFCYTIQTVAKICHNTYESFYLEYIAYFLKKPCVYINIIHCWDKQR